jgi:pyruvate kinase
LVNHKPCQLVKPENTLIVYSSEPDRDDILKLNMARTYEIDVISFRKVKDPEDFHLMEQVFGERHPSKKFVSIPTRVSL